MNINKFKLWDKENKEWDNSGNIYLDETGQLYEMYEAGGFSQYMYRENVTDRYGIVFWTGLNDKNKKEIYDGDIVESSHPIYDRRAPNVNAVKFIDYCWRLEAIGEGMVANAPIGLYAQRPDTIVVIGNIYENPELLAVMDS